MFAMSTSISARLRSAWATARELSWTHWRWVGSLGALALLGLGWACWLALGQLRQAEDRLAAQRVKPLPTAARPAAAAQAQDFVAAGALPAQLDPDQALLRIQQACQDAGVSLLGLRWTPDPAGDATQLQRAELALQLRGTYPALRRALGEALARVPGLTLRQLSLRRAAAGAEVEAELLLSLWARPLALPAQGAR